MINISIYGWVIPVFITMASLGWALFIYDDGTSGTGYFAGLGNMIMLVPALGISCLSWIIYSIILIVR